MKDFDLEFRLMKASPTHTPVDAAFTERVMQSIVSTSLRNAIKEPKQKSLLFRLRHLPKFAVVVLAIAALFTLSGVTYAIVETIKQANQNVKVEKSGINSHGREELNVAFDNCAQLKKDGTTYELKKDSGLSAEDGAKVLQAQCERDNIAAWAEKDPALSSTTSEAGINFVSIDIRMSGLVGTFRGLSDAGIAIHSTTAFTLSEQDRTLPFPKDTRVIEWGKAVDPKTLKPGDTILYFAPREPGHKPSDISKNVVVFKLSLDAKYYSLDMESYIRARQPCENNPSVTCLVSNHTNMVYLQVTRGGASVGQDRVQYVKTIQGKVLSWNDNEIKVDAGNGAIYTFHTDRNVIDTYNKVTVYGLAAYDSIYAKTDPNALKIGVGDTLEIGYEEDSSQSGRVIEWSQVTGINLMVERTIKDLSILRKY